MKISKYDLGDIVLFNEKRYIIIRIYHYPEKNKYDLTPHSYMMLDKYDFTSLNSNQRFINENQLRNLKND